MAMGRSFTADAAVLAIGNLPPYLPPGLDASAARHPTFFGDPWSANFGGLPVAGEVVLIGRGLTMVDVVLRLSQARPAVTMLGDLTTRSSPGAPSDKRSVPQPFAPHPKSSPLALLRNTRTRVRTDDWRCVIDGLRPHIQDIWRTWPLREREQFHLRAWWEVHRHRIARSVASNLDHLTASDGLRIVAGRLASISADGNGTKALGAGES